MSATVPLVRLNARGFMSLWFGRGVGEFLMMVAWMKWMRLVGVVQDLQGARVLFALQESRLKLRKAACFKTLWPQGPSRLVGIVVVVKSSFLADEVSSGQLCSCRRVGYHDE